MYVLVLIRMGSQFLLRSVSVVVKVTSTNGFTSSCFIVTVLNCPRLRRYGDTFVHPGIRATVINRCDRWFPTPCIAQQNGILSNLLSPSSQLAPTAAAEMAAKWHKRALSWWWLQLVTALIFALEPIVQWFSFPVHNLWFFLAQNLRVKSAFLV